MQYTKARVLFAGFIALNPKNRREGGKPQIPQISQMTEAKELWAIRRMNSSGTKMCCEKPCSLLLQSAKSAEICGFNFGI
jgi:hypothetical protein